MTFSFIDPWHDFLPREGGHVVSFMGSGGKTSLQLLVADIYEQEHVQTVLTNTTLCEVLPEVLAVPWNDLKQREAGEWPAKIYVHAGEDEQGKWRGLTGEQVDQLAELLPDRVALVEVDGARKMPLKIYRSGEPVWPERTSLAFVVLGVGAVGCKVEESVHRWGSKTLPGLENLRGDSVMEWRHLQTLLQAEGGYMAQLPVGVPAVLVLAGLSDQDDTIGLFEFVGQAMADPRLPLVVFCSRSVSEQASGASPTESWDMRTAAVDSPERS